MSKNSHFGSDIQVAAAILKRVGLGSLLSGTSMFGGNAVYPTGPLNHPVAFNPAFTNTTVDPLYTHCDITIAWTDGSTYSMAIDYDIVYQDMTTVVTDFGGAVTTNSNIAATWNQDWAGFSIHPGSAPANSDYSPFSGGTYSQSASGTTGTMQWTGWVDINPPHDPPNPPFTHWGCTITIALSGPKNYSDYADACIANILDTFTLGAEYTNYTGAQLVSGEPDFQWTWIKNFLSGSTTQTNSVLGVLSRSGGVQVKHCTSFSAIQGGVESRNSNLLVFTLNTYSGSTGLPNVTYRKILSAYGAPAQATDSVLEMDNDLNILSTDALAPYVLCVKSCVRNTTPMGDNFKQVTYDPAANASSFAWSTAGGLPSTNSQTNFTPNSTLGFISCPFTLPVTIRPMVWGISFPNLADYFNAQGSYPMTVYAMTQDDFGSLIETIPATWSLTNITGSIMAGDLVASTDGRSAVFSPGSHHGTCKIQCTAAGITSVPSGTLSN